MVVLALLAALIWGVWSYVEIRGVRMTNPLGFNVLMAIGFLVSNALVWPLSAWLARKTGQRIVWSWKLLLVVMAGALFVELAGLMLLFAMREGKGSKAVVVASVYPVVTALLAWWLDRERLGARGWAGVVLVMIGLVLVVRE